MKSEFMFSDQEGMDLGTELFHLVSALTPIINVDLLIQRERLGIRETLLVWREDEFYRGWHLPGGVIRFKESMLNRVELVGKEELGANFSVVRGPIHVSEKMNYSRNTRGHFISLLFECELENQPSQEHLQLGSEVEKNGHWAWHEKVPDSFLTQQELYEKYI